MSAARRRRAAAALLYASMRPRQMLHEAMRLPLRQQARELIAGLPVVELGELLGRNQWEGTLRLPAPGSRHAWNLGAAKQIVLELLVQARHVQTAFEIGTFNGGTTRLLAESVPEDGVVWTLDLPANKFDSTQQPGDFSGAEVGSMYRDSPAEGKIVQLYGDSRSFDFTPYADSADLVLVDGGHGYDHGFSDTRTALSLVRAGGLILWDDFEPYWHGLVSGVTDAMVGRELNRLAGTSFAVYSADTA